MCMYLNISRSAFYRKCKGITQFTQGEIEGIVNKLKLNSPMGIFLKRKCHKRHRGGEQHKERRNTVDIERKISEFAKNELKEAEEAKKKEKKQVCINPDSMIGKEIKYQTALLHEILHELRNRG